MGSATQFQFRRRGKRLGSHETAPLEISQLATRVARRWPTVVLTALVVLALVILATLLAPRSYTATTSVAVTPVQSSSPSGDATPANVDMPTEIATAGSRVVAQRAAEDLSGGQDEDLLSELLHNTEIGSPSESTVLRFNVSASSATTAAEHANALARAYLDDRAETADSRTNSTADALEKSLDTVSVDEAARQALEERLVELRSSSSWPGRIISPAVAPSSSTGPGLASALLAGALGGLMVGLVVALIRDRVASRVDFGDRLEERTGTLTVDAVAESMDTTVATTVSALDERFGLNSRGRLAVITLHGELPEDLVEEFAQQLDTWSVTPGVLGDSRPEIQRLVDDHDALVVMIHPRENLRETSQLLAALDRGSTTILPVVWDGMNEGRS